MGAFIEVGEGNTSYTKRDFEAVYKELLDATQQLTRVWNPSQSNESDPGVVLLKLGALLTDKINYAVDKQILETFPVSVTQRGNAQKLFDSLGYEMRWYQSAITYVQIAARTELWQKYGTFKFPKYRTHFRSDDGTYVFSLIDDVVLTSDQSALIASNNRVIEGVVTALEINGETNITAHHLDEYNRIYFPEQVIA